MVEFFKELFIPNVVLVPFKKLHPSIDVGGLFTTGG